jgi:Ca-activated chloride channel family protein
VWTQRVDGELYATPVVAGDSVYASTIGGNSYRFLLPDRQAGVGATAERDHRAVRRRRRATCQPAHQGGRGAGGRVRGDRRRRAHARRPARAVPVGRAAQPRQLEAAVGVRGIAPGDLARRPLRRARRRHRGRDPETGAAYWIRTDAAAAGKRSVGSVAIAGPQVVVSTRAGQLYGLDVDTGYTLWAYDVGHPVVAQPIVARGWVYVATTDGLSSRSRSPDATLDGWHMFGGQPPPHTALS